MAAFTASTIGSIAILTATPQMSPENIQESAELIQMELHHDPILQGSDLTVKIDNKVATISGTADSLAQAERAASRAYASPDVAAVVDRVEIKTKPSDRILADAEESLNETKLLDADGVDVDVDGSVIVLTGTVGSEDEAELARELISEITRCCRHR